MNVTITRGPARFLLVLGLGLSLAAVVMLARSVSGSSPASGKLKNAIHTVTWSGALSEAGAPSGEVPECAAVACDRFDLEVDLHPGVWNNKPGGLQIAVRWPLNSFGDNLRLYVYRDGALAAKSDGIIAATQSLLIPEAADGLYSVYVAFDPDSTATSLPYEALAEVEYAPNPRPERQLLPDLVARPQRNVSLRTPDFDFFEPAPAPGESCFDSEKEEDGAQTCLRFDQVFANTGEGPMELRFTIPHDTGVPADTIFQRVYRSGGGFDERPGGELEFHPVHQHYHYTGFGLSRLWASNAAGEQLSARPVRSRKMRVGNHLEGQPVRTGRKVSFCMADIEIDFWLGKGDGPRTFNAPDCLSPASSDADNDYYVQGITQGWADVYDWYLPDQYIEVTGVPDGYYILETTADPDGTLLEADETNNCGSVLIRLTNMGTPAQAAEIVSPGPACG